MAEHSCTGNCLPVELTRKPQTRANTTHDLGYELQQKLNNGNRYKSSEAYLIQIFVSRTFDFKSADGYVIPDFIRV